MRCPMTSAKSGWINFCMRPSVVAADPDDDKFIECAVTAGATVIVSGDHHLLDLGTYGDIQILTAVEFLGRFQD